MKLFLMYFLAASIFAGSVFAAFENVPIRREQGGARLVVASGGSLDVASGGEIDVESGGSLKLLGVAITSTAAELNKMDGVTSSTAELNILDGVTSTAAELNILDGVTSSTAELNKLDGVTASSGELSITAASAQLLDGLLAKRVARATLDCGASSCVVGAVTLGVSLPAKSIITQMYVFTVTQFVDAGAGTVAISCEDAGNLIAATDLTGITAGTITTGLAVGTAAFMVSDIAAACELTATVAVAEQTAGVMNMFVEYVVHD